MYLHYLFLLIFACLATASASSEAEEDAGYPMILLVACCVMTVSLSAMYCGLTIGIMGMDTTTLEIIAEAGPTPDCIYAGQILPLRRLGHQLLVMLLLGNMLTLVVTSQLIAAIVQSTVLINFICSTTVVLVFGEIIPMSICSNGKYALYLGATSIPALRLSLFVLYPVSRPLGLLLDYLVPHEAGEVFDRSELKKLIRLHSEKFASQTGLGDEESKMIVSALELKESCVADVMTPLDKVRMMECSTVIDSTLEKTLWEWGKSRIPVYCGDRSKIMGLLYVKSLIGAFSKAGERKTTLHDFLLEQSTDIIVISKDMSLLHALSVFESNRVQLLFVSGEEFEGGTPVMGTPKDTSEIQPHVTCRMVAQESLIKEELSMNVAGIVTLEDIIEELISAEILDEDEWESNEGEEYDEIRSSPSMREDASSSARPAHAPRVNFYSFGVPEDYNAQRHPLSSDQRWVLAHFLSRSYVLFATWTIPHIVMLLNEVEDAVVYPSHSDEQKLQLYKCNQPSKKFTLLLSGCVTVNYNASIQTDIFSFTSLGDEVLLSGREFVPKYTATISRPSRLLFIRISDIKSVEQQINKMRLCHREEPVHLLPQHDHMQIVEAKTKR